MTAPMDWLAGGGEMGELIRSMDWAKTPLGPLESWPQSLRTTVSLCLSSTFPILIAWGPDRVQIYNDSYRPICGEMHPQSMGQRFNECWASALPAVGHVLDRAQGGEGSYIENLRMFLERFGYLEEAWMTFSFSPIRDESGGVGGLFHPITEVTEKMLSARRTQGLRDLTARLVRAKSVAEIGAEVTAFRDLDLDIPFVLFYGLDESRRTAKLLAHAGLEEGSAAHPELVPLDPANGEGDAWGLGDVFRADAAATAFELDDLAARVGPLVSGPYPESPTSAMMIPIRPPGAATPVACIVAGVSARRALDATYRAFFEVLGSTVTTAVANVLAYAEEQRRAEALAQIDRAKTAFFSNVSHEFRTPLTLMMGPVEDSLADTSDPLSPAQRERVELAQRNGVRLLKLVNTLLDFSRIEAGRVQVSYQATDLAALTVDLASAFRSLVERANLALTVECAPLPESVWVDREMWEKIVLNLLSNAYKHTFVGGVTVRLAWHGDHEPAAVLTVSDTGTGIAADQLPRLFERFHRIEGARGRSHEGSGIGLALVQELVALHSGTVQVDSELGAGTTFTVTIPGGRAHLAADRIDAAPTAALPTAARANAFLHEAIAWDGSAAKEQMDIEAAPVAAVGAARARVLLVDDNADMRAYVQRLLESRYVVTTASDGEAALALSRELPPDLILTDVMMPRLDGFGLLRALKQDPKTSSVPVILLSARAGEEATLEGLSAGAVDYLVKPFSARELLGRVDAAIEIARARTRLEQTLESMGDGFFVADREWRFTFVNPSYAQMINRPRGEILGRRLWDIFPDLREAGPATELRRCMDTREAVHFVTHHELLARWLDVRATPSPEGIAVLVRDVSEDKRMEDALRRAVHFSDQFIGVLGHDLRNPLHAITMAASLLERHPDSASVGKWVNRIGTSASRMERMIAQLLDLTHIRIGRGLPLATKPGDLATLARTIIDELEPVQKRVIELESRGDVRGVFDPDRLSQLLSNLVANACQHGTPGSPVVVRLDGEDVDRLRLEVHNRGAVPAAIVPTIFEPLMSTSYGAAPLRSGSSGLGLGLYITREIAVAHGGTIRVESSERDGTRFVVELPRQSVTSGEETMFASRRPEDSTATARALLDDANAGGD